MDDEKFIYVKDNDGDWFKLPDYQIVRATLEAAGIEIFEDPGLNHVFLDFEDDHDGTAFLGFIGTKMPTSVREFVETVAAGNTDADDLAEMAQFVLDSGMIKD